MLYFTSDIHFDDDRAFQSRIILRTQLDPDWNNEKNNKFIIDSWNTIVNPEDTVVIVGDVSVTKDGYENVKKLNGKKILVKGNYDNEQSDDFLKEYFDEVHENMYFKKDNIYVSHKPTDCVKFNKDNGGNVKCICGHIHGLWRIQEGIVNVSFEAWENQPITKDYVLTLFDNMKKYYDDDVFIGRKIYEKDA